MMLRRVQKILSNNIFLTFCSILILVLPMMIVNYLYFSIKEAIYALKSGTEFLFPDFFQIDKTLLPLYLIVFVFSIITCILFLYRMNVRYKNISNNEKGSQRFTTIEEIRQQYKTVPEKDKAYKGDGGVLISRDKENIYIDDSPVNNLIVGITRCGKTHTFVIPSIDVYSRATNKPSLIIADPKLELAAASIEILEKRGYMPFVFNLISPKSGMGYNPFEIIKEEYKKGDYGAAQLLARTFSFMLFHDESAHDKAWQEWSISLSNAIILAHIIDCVKNGEEEKINPASVARMVIRMGTQKTANGKSNALEDFIHKRPENDIARIQYAGVEFAPSEKTKPTIFAQFMAKFEVFTYEPMVHMCSHNSIQLSDIGFGDKPIALFLGIPDYDRSNHFLASLLIRQIYYVLSKKATIEGSGKCKRQVVFLLDEFGNMPPIPDMDTIITMCLGRNIRFNLIVQSYEQLESKYQDKTAKTIIGNCGNQIYLLSSEKETAARFSDLLGKETITVYGRSEGAKGKTISEHIDAKELLNQNELMSLLEGESVVHRVIKRTDLKGRKIKPRPIYNRKENSLKFAYKYLPEFNTSATEGISRYTPIEDIGDYENLVYRPEKKSNEKKRLKELLNEQKLKVFASLIGSETGLFDEMNMTELKQFLQASYDRKKITKETVISALKFIRTNTTEGE